MLINTINCTNDEFATTLCKHMPESANINLTDMSLFDIVNRFNPKVLFIESKQISEEILHVQSKSNVKFVIILNEFFRIKKSQRQLISKMNSINLNYYGEENNNKWSSVCATNQTYYAVDLRLINKNHVYSVKDIKHYNFNRFIFHDYNQEFEYYYKEKINHDTAIFGSGWKTGECLGNISKDSFQKLLMFSDTYIDDPSRPNNKAMLALLYGLDLETPHKYPAGNILAEHTYENRVEQLKGLLS